METAPALAPTSPLRKAWVWLEDALFPPRCLGCARAGAWCCGACLASLSFPRSLTCPACAAPSELGAFCTECHGERSLSGLWCAQAYGNPLVREMVRALKFDGLTELVPTLGNLLTATLRTYALPPAWHEVARERWFLTPVPLHLRRARGRGFNQSVLLAAEAAKGAGLKLAPVLEREHSTAPQSELSHGEERLANVANAFTVTARANVVGNAYILVDDVYTSGATLEACARELKAAGAAEVWGLTVAKG